MTLLWVSLTFLCTCSLHFLFLGLPQCTINTTSTAAPSLNTTILFSPLLLRMPSYYLICQHFGCLWQREPSYSLPECVSIVGFRYCGGILANDSPSSPCLPLSVSGLSLYFERRSVLCLFLVGPLARTYRDTEPSLLPAHI